VATGIEGVVLRPLEAHLDERGALVEVCRHAWVEHDVPVQWNLVVNRPGALRGVHWHELHTDYLSAVSGACDVVLVDLRPGSPTELVSERITLDSEAPALVEIPAGVGHGFWSPAPSALLYAVTRYYDAGDEYGVRHDDPELGLPWPVQAAAGTVSERDLAMPLWRDAARPPAWGVAA
jgi:dTDP-4-dehydrorhamnose 3,5-epimerase